MKVQLFARKHYNAKREYGNEIGHSLVMLRNFREIVSYRSILQSAAFLNFGVVNLLAMTKFSVTIITLNEEKNIARCLDSVKNVADEIVVVDSFSADNTEAICREYGAKFIKQKFLGYIEQKKFAVSQASNIYVLSLDADEALSPELEKSILNLKQQGNLADAYTMNRLNRFCDRWIKHGAWYPDKKIRLFKKNAGKWGGENPHDKIEMNPGSKIKHLDGDLLHYTYQSIEEFVLQGNKFSTIAANEKFKQNKKAGFLNLLINPFWVFIVNYIIKAGFLDGYYGFIIARLSAYHTFLKYAKLIKLQRRKKKEA